MTVRFSKKRGFTLIEMLIAIPLFLIIATAAADAYLSLAQYSRIQESTRNTLDNLNVVLEDMTRTIRTGSKYACFTNAGVIPTAGSTNDCVSGNAASGIEFLNQDGKQTAYYVSGGILYKTSYYQDPTTGTYQASQVTTVLTDPNLLSLNTSSFPVFQVRGSSPGSLGDLVQPYVVIHIHGQITVGSTVTQVNVQTTATQRSYDGP